MQKTDYKTLQAELDKILNELQDGDVDIDRSIELYKQGQTLVKQLQKHLDKAKNEIKSLSKNS